MKINRRIKLFFANGIGDLVLALPTIRAFTTKFVAESSLIVGDDAPIQLLGELLVPIETVESHWIDGHRLISQGVELGTCDIFISLVQWDHPSVHRMAQKMSARITIGHFETFDVHRPLYANMHCVEQTFSLFKIFVPDATSTVFSWPLVFNPSVEATYRTLRSIFPPAPLLVVHFDTAKAKLPPVDWVNRVLLLVKQTVHCHIVLVGQESSIIQKPSADAEILDSLELCMLLTSRADAFFGADSCMLHVADLHKRPLVATFLTTNEGEFGRRLSPFHRHISSEIDGYCHESAAIASRYLCNMLQVS